MFFTKSKKDKDDNQQDEQIFERSIQISNEKIDRHGQAWKKKEYWILKEYLTKLKIIAHFKNVKTSVLVNQALGEYVEREFDKSQALRKLVNPEEKVK